MQCAGIDEMKILVLVKTAKRRRKKHEWNAVPFTKNEHFEFAA